MEEFVSRSEIMDQQLDDKNEDLLLREMKIEAILAIDNSPYLEGELTDVCCADISPCQR
jgi:hypothetical protein